MLLSPYFFTFSALLRRVCASVISWKNMEAVSAAMIPAISGLTSFSSCSI